MPAKMARSAPLPEVTVAVRIALLPCREPGKPRISKPVPGSSGESRIKALGNAFMATQLSDAGLAAQAVQNYPDLLFGRMAFAGCPADVLHDPLRRRFSVYGFLSHLHSLMVTMSQKSSATCLLYTSPSPRDRTRS